MLPIWNIRRKNKTKNHTKKIYSDKKTFKIDKKDIKLRQLANQFGIIFL